MSVRAVAAVPSAPMLVVGVSPRQPVAIADEVAALRASALEVLRGLPDVDAIVVLTGGADATLPDGGCVDLAGYGHPQVRAELPVDRELLTAIATGTGTPRVRADVLTGDLAVLTLLVAEARPGAVVVPVTVASAAGAPSLSGFAAGLSGAIDASGREVAVLAAGDLSASRDTTSPGYLVEGAIDWDEAAVAALADADVDAFARLGPAEARRVAARAWAPLTVALTVARAADLRFARCALSAPRGVGQLVATTAP